MNRNDSAINMPRVFRSPGDLSLTKNNMENFSAVLQACEPVSDVSPRLGKDLACFKAMAAACNSELLQQVSNDPVCVVFRPNSTFNRDSFWQKLKESKGVTQKLGVLSGGVYALLRQYAVGRGGRPTHVFIMTKPAEGSSVATMTVGFEPGVKPEYLQILPENDAMAKRDIGVAQSFNAAEHCELSTDIHPLVFHLFRCAAFYESQNAIIDCTEEVHSNNPLRMCASSWGVQDKHLDLVLSKHHNCQTRTADLVVRMEKIQGYLHNHSGFMAGTPAAEYLSNINPVTSTDIHWKAGDGRCRGVEPVFTGWHVGGGDERLSVRERFNLVGIAVTPLVVTHQVVAGTTYMASQAVAKSINIAGRLLNRINPLSALELPYGGLLFGGGEIDE